jgi:uncharacterized protein
MERTTQGEFATVDFAAKDFDGQTDFYEKLFGWAHADLPTPKGPYRMFSKQGGSVAGGYPLSPDMEAAGVPTMWNTYIAVDNVDAMAHKAERLGGTIVMPAVDAEGYGRFVGIQDPTGGILFLWHSNTPDPDAKYSEPGALAWNDLSTPDPEKAVEYFRQLFDWDIAAMTGGLMPYWVISVNGTRQAGIMPMPETVPSDVPANWLVYFGAEDARALAQRVVELGGRVLVEPTQADDMVWAILSDPQGATFGILQSGPQ